VTAEPIAPVIPSPGRVAGAPRVKPTAVRPLPMAGLAAALSVPADVVYGTGRIDASGRVADQAISCALDWREGGRLTLTASPGVVTARRDPAGMVTVPARACLAIPAVLRRRCGLGAGDRVLLAALPGQDGGDELDTLLLRLHTETACRRGGALALRPDDLDTDQCLIRLREKGETVRWQPVSPTLMARLVEHGDERHAPPGGQLLRYRTGGRSPPAAMTACGPASAAPCRGSAPSRSACTGSGTFFLLCFRVAIATVGGKRTCGLRCSTTSSSLALVTEPRETGQPATGQGQLRHGYHRTRLVRREATPYRSGLA
jgi:hypothetical protein